DQVAPTLEGAIARKGVNAINLVHSIIPDEMFRCGIPIPHAQISRLNRHRQSFRELAGRVLCALSLADITYNPENAVGLGARSVQKTHRHFDPDRATIFA